MEAGRDRARPRPLPGVPRASRRRVVSALLLELTYHVEHHLYPQVPSHRLARLAPAARPGPRRGRSETLEVI
ncbi:fatty acid desaturase [Actinomadura chibensis]|uniref:Fatty acid desaturase n=1 Tax=Actinomadura chibensis TaxID=392828 RepID=A0A5D0NCI9_9ACTN|nr:fatty acid desaturase [Actinomadura chibensis]